jgi:putative sterol carrier protein
MISTEQLAELATRFRPEAARGLTAVYQLELTGDGGGVWHMIVADQTCRIFPGAAANPNTEITVSSSDWEALITGKLDAMSAVLLGQVKIAGDLSLATRLPSLFGM